MACGDLSGFDSDRSYPLELSSLFEDFKDWKYSFRKVNQSPTEPAYKKACELKRFNKLEKLQDLLPPKNNIRISQKKPKTLDVNEFNDTEILETLGNFFIDDSLEK